MKNKILLFVCSALCVCACNENQFVGEPDNQLINFVLDCGDAQNLKSTSSSGESLTDTVQLAVYSPSGFLVGSGYFSESKLQLSLPVNVPNYTVVAFVNSKIDLSKIATLNDLSYNSSLTNNSAAGKNALEMYGRKDSVTFIAGKDCSIEVARYASKVEIDQIVNKSAGKKSFKITGIYLVNVNTSCAIDGTVSSATWAQKLSYNASETDVIKYTADIFEQEVSYDGSYSTPHYFYCYPNTTTTDSNAATWSERYTRLVVQALYEGKTCYYPINIVSTDKTLHGSSCYKVTKLTITGPGSDSPDSPIEKGNANFSITVQNWNSGFSQTVEY